MDRKILITASVSGVLAVVFGAFGAHSLKAVLSASDLEIWKTGVSYQFYHTIALLFLSLLNIRGKLVGLAYGAFSLGILLFSGSLYLLSSRVLTGLNWPFLGPVTPVGGLFFIIGWISLLVLALKNK